jgi:hypothetical protein
MPHKFALDFGNLDFLTVQGGDDTGVPVVVNQVKLGGEVNRQHGSA